MKLSERAKERLLFGLIGLLAGWLGYALQATARDASPAFVQHVLPAISKSSLLWLCLTLLATTVFALTWVGILLFSDKGKRTLKEYAYHEDRGFYTHKKTSQRVCGSCLTDKHVASPLSINYITPHGGHSRNHPVWQCAVKECGMKYFVKEEELQAIKNR